MCTLLYINIHYHYRIPIIITNHRIRLFAVKSCSVQKELYPFTIISFYSYIKVNEILNALYSSAMNSWLWCIMHHELEPFVSSVWVSRMFRVWTSKFPDPNEISHENYQNKKIETQKISGQSLTRPYWIRWNGS